MADRFRLTLAQLNPVVGDLAGNAARARTAWEQARAEGADMVALPEMFITGYQTQDLILKPAFHRAAIAMIEALARDCADGPAMGIGGPVLEHGHLHNGWYVLAGGRIHARVLKQHLPNEDVFDEHRLFQPGPPQGPYSIGPLRIGSPVCEDAWHPDVAETLAETGAEMLLVPNGSPYARGKMEIRQNLMVARVIETGLPLVYLNMVGGQDDQVFDGGSFVLNPGGALAVQLPLFDEAVVSVDFTHTPDGWIAADGARAPIPEPMEQDYRAMVDSLRDYMRKTGFKTAILGLSGGIDSAIVATIAADAIGAANVRCVMLPSEYTSQASLDDARAVADALGCAYDTVPITGPRAAVTAALAPLFEGHSPDLTEENIQSRLRGLLLMAMSNKFGNMLLTTGNKSEVAVGYATIYGDMAGGYNPIKDMYKTRVFAACRWRNAHHRDWMMGPVGEVIPPRIIDKPPSAELRPDQKDEDSLPPYPVLDDILKGLIEGEESVDVIVARGHDRDLVNRVWRMLEFAEYKRRQACPGVKITRRAFGKDRRYPITNAFKGPA